MTAPVPILNKLCIVSSSIDEFNNNIAQAIKLPFSKKNTKHRKDVLLKHFNDLENSKVLIDQIFNK